MTSFNSDLYGASLLGLSCAAQKAAYRALVSALGG